VAGTPGNHSFAGWIKKVTNENTCGVVSKMPIAFTVIDRRNGGTGIWTCRTKDSISPKELSNHRDSSPILLHPDLPDTAARILRKRDLGIGSLSARLLCLNDLDRFVELEG